MKKYIILITVSFIMKNSYSQDTSKTYKVSKNYQKIDDSLFSMGKTKRINDLQIKGEIEKKNLKIEAQKASIALLNAKSKVKNQWMLFGSVLLSVFFSKIVFRLTKKKKKQQEKFSHDLIQFQEAEKTRIARELHDSIGQQLTLIKRKSQNLGLPEITKMTNNALEEVRSISRNLHPILLTQLGLTESIEQLINEYDEQTDLLFSVNIDKIDAYFTDPISLNFYRLVQECLTNIVKHAKAKTVTITIKKENNTIVAFISDNGKGFNVSENKKKNSLGIKTISERIKIMNGKLFINSKLGIGTSFIFSIPIKNQL